MNSFTIFQRPFSTKWATINANSSWRWTQTVKRQEPHEQKKFWYENLSLFVFHFYSLQKLSHSATEIVTEVQVLVLVLVERVVVVSAQVPSIRHPLRFPRRYFVKVLHEQLPSLLKKHELIPDPPKVHPSLSAIQPAGRCSLWLDRGDRTYLLSNLVPV